MAALVDGTATSADVRGILQGNGGESDRIAGTSGNDRIEGHASQNYYYGGDGSDTFILAAKFLTTGTTTAASGNYSDAVMVINDLQGAGGYSATNNDFVAFTGFGTASTITQIGSGHSTSSANAPNAVLYYYDLYDSATQLHYTIAVNSVNGKALGAGDYNFYS